METNKSKIERAIVKAEFSRIIFSSETWMIASYINLATDDKFVAVADKLPTTRHVVLNLEGQWISNPKYGLQLSVNLYTVDLPTTEEGVTSYFKSLEVGVGPKRAQLLFREFGDRIWEVIREKPERVAAVEGFNDDIANMIRTAIMDSERHEALSNELRDYMNTTYKQISDVISVFGADTLEIIKLKPYLLCCIEGFSFADVDKYALGRGKSPFDILRLTAAIDYVFQDISSKGHTCFPALEFRAKMVSMLNDLVGANRDLHVNTEQCSEAIRKAVDAGSVMCTSGMLYAASSYEQEVSITERLHHLACQQSPIEEVEALISEFEADTGIKLGESQKEAVNKVFSNTISVITGSPGTGKTTIIKCILYVHRKVYGDKSVPCLMAPTGRAARKMTETTGYMSATLHSALGIVSEQSQDDIDEGQDLNGNIVVIDEFSMVDQFVASRLFKHIPPEARVVIVGDPDQLPSVGSGNILSDIIGSQKIPTTELDVIFRQSEDNPIIHNAQAIKHGNPELMLTKTFKMIETEGTDATMNQACSLYIKCVKHYGIDNVILLNPYKHKTQLSVLNFNSVLQEAINPQKGGELVLKRGKTEFRIGDRVMQVKNTEYAKNGDTGYIKDICMKASPENENEMIVSAEIEFNGRGELHNYSKYNAGEIELAYCTTVHKSQGSEYEIVIIIVSDVHPAALKRNLIYTAVTRARTCVALIGQKSALCKAIRDDKTDQRYTLLKGRIHTKIA